MEQERTASERPPPDMPPLSVFIITKNEAARLPRAVASVKGIADEVVVVDSGSEDGTPEVARSLGAAVHSREWTGYGPQKRFAEGLCRNEWRLNLDADEEVTPDLADEIVRKLRGADPCAFSTRILTIYPGEDRPRPFADDYRVVRLYHAAAGRFQDHPLHDRVAVSGHVEDLRAPLHHRPFADWSGLVAKLDALTTFQAEHAPRKPLWQLRLRLLTEGPLVFLKTWLWRRHLFGGWSGFVYSGVAAFGRWLRIVKMLERAQRRDERSAVSPAEHRT